MIDPLLKFGKSRKGNTLAQILLIKCLLISFLNASGSDAQHKSLYEIEFTPSLERTTVFKVFKEIETKTEFLFTYNTRHIRDQEVSLQRKKQTVGDVLEGISRATNLAFRRIDENIHVSIAQKRKYRVEEAIKENILETITGSVKDEAGMSLPGVTILVKGTSRGTVTDLDGNFSIEASSEDILVFSFVGYQTKEVAVGSSSNLKVTMEIDVTTLTEIVVIGYGIEVNKDDLTGAAAIVDGESLTSSGSAGGDIGNTLQGRVAGLDVTTGSSPGSRPRIVLRGVGSFTNTDPLFVVDGIPGNRGIYDGLRPDDIESITVLKDAASSAIYGAQGANGVVLVTTKRGKKGALRLNYRGYAGVSYQPDRIGMMNNDQYIAFGEEYFGNLGESLPARWTSDEFDHTVQRTNWEDELFRNAFLTEHVLTAQGGTDVFTYSITGNYYNEESTIIGSEIERSRLAFRLTQQLGKLKLYQNIYTRYETQDAIKLADGRDVELSVLKQLRMPPYAPIEDPNEIGGFFNNNPADDSNDMPNQFARLNNTFRDRRFFDINLQLVSELDIVKGLRLRNQFSFGYSALSNNEYQREYVAGGVLNERRADDQVRFSAAVPQIDNILTYTNEIGKHQFSVSLGNSFYNGGSVRQLSLTGRGFPNDEITNVGPAEEIELSADYSSGTSSQLSYFGRIDYSFAGRYLLNASFRRDGRTVFSESRRFGNFPSIGLGWVPSEEAFFKDNIDFISRFKLSGSWGILGNSNIANFAFEPRTWRGDRNNVGYALGSGEDFVNGTTVTEIPVDLRWEETTVLNVGADIGLFDNKLTVGVDYYDRQNDGLLVRIPIAPSTGQGSPGSSATQLANAASMQNIGWEFNAGYQNALGDFTYSVQANAAFNENEVTSLGSENGIPIRGGGRDGVVNPTITDIGLPISTYWGYELIKVASTQAEINQLNQSARDITGDPGAVYQDGLLPGDYIFADHNGDGVVNQDDEHALGDAQPGVVYGGIIQLTYKNFDLFTSFTGLADYQVFSGWKFQLEGSQRFFNKRDVFTDRWRQPGDDATYPRAGQNATSNLRNSTFYIEDAGFFKLREITIGYSLPKSLLSSIAGNAIGKVRFYVSGQNLLFITNYDGYNPEGNFSVFGRGVDYLDNVLNRTILGGLQVQF